MNRVMAIDKVDVLVVGGGPAGCAAAIAAAREGAKTLLVEQFGFLGGMGTAGLVPAFCPFTDQREVILRGIGLEVLEEMKRGMAVVPPEQFDWVPIDAELLKAIYDVRVSGSGAEILFLTHYVDAVVSNGLVRSVRLHNKSGLQTVDVDVVIDCSGDADVVARAGGDFEIGEEKSGELQPCTMCFVLGGIDNDRLQKFLWADDGKNLLLRQLIAEAKKAGDLDIVEEAANVAYQSPTTIGLNFSHVFGVDATNGRELSQAQLSGRRLVQHLTEFVREYCPGCEKAYLVNSGVHIGVRETRRVCGEYKLTLDDYRHRRKFADDIACNAYYIDIHISKEFWEEGCQEGIDWDEQTCRYEPGESYGIPYRCLLPRGLGNVLVAGRCISTDRAVHGSTRVMPVCFATGEAAGCAAAMAVRKHRGMVGAVDAGMLRKRLVEHGQYLPEHVGD